MATLDPGNIVNGNVIETNDLLQLYQAFGTGSGASITGLAMTGSLNGNASTATTATTATSASNLTTAVVSTPGNYYLTMTDAVGTKPIKIHGTLEYNTTTYSLAVTASHAVSSSYAANASVSQVQGSYDTGTVNTGNFKFVAGRVNMSNAAATSSAFPLLAGKTLGTDAWITANYQNGAAAADILMVTSISSSGEILFDGFGGQPTSATVVFTGFYI